MIWERPSSPPVPKQLACPTQAEEFLKMLAVSTIKKDYGSQKDFTQVWNSTMEGVRWAGAGVEGRKKAARPY